MSSFKSVSSLKGLEANTTKSVNFANRHKKSSSSNESIPVEERWWANKFRLTNKSGLLKSKKHSTSTSVTYQTPSAGSAIISHATFAPNAIKGYPYQMAIASGPRVCLYGGTASSSLARALARPGTNNPNGNTTEEKISLFGQMEEEKKSSDVKPDRSVSTSGLPANYVAYHTDGRLLAVACDDGCIKICDSTSRATIRTFATNHKNSAGENGGTGKGKGYPMRVVGWVPESYVKNSDDGAGTKLIWSAGDDAILRVWDLSGNSAATKAAGGVSDSAKPIAEIRGHGDSIRACASFEHNDRLLMVSGSYDHTIRVWDMDGIGEVNNTNDDSVLGNCLSVMDHGAPVESLIVVDPPKTNDAKKFPIVISAGGSVIKLWNPILGTCISTLQTKHSKTITNICMVSIIREERPGEEMLGDDKGRVFSKRLMSAGLDGLIRIYSADELFENITEKKQRKSYDLPYVHGVKTPHPITALAMSPDSTKLVIGTSGGLVTVRLRAKFVIQGTKRKSFEPRAGTFSYFMRGADAQADADDHVVILQKKKKLHRYDIFLRKFQYSEALDDALKNRDTTAIIAVMEELGRRKGLEQAISNRDEETLEPLLAFTANNIHVPKHSPVLIGVANQICSIYANVYGQSETIDEYFKKLQNKVSNEVRAQKVLSRLVGQIDAVMYQAEL